MSADRSAAAPGDLVTVSTTVTLPVQASFDSTLLTQLPEGLEYVETVSVQCSTGQPCTEGDPAVLTPSGRTVGVFLGDLEESYSWAPQVTVVIQARVADDATGTLTATATLAWDEADRLSRPAAVSELGDFDRVSDPGSVEVAVAVPALQVSAAVLDGDAADDGTLRLALPAVEPGETATVTYRLRVPTPDPGEQVGTLSSAMEVSRSSAPGEVPGEPSGTAAASVTVQVGEPGGVLTGRVRVESLRDGRVTGYAAGVRVVVRWLGPDRQPGGGDDVRVATSTDAAGRWPVGALRPGWYQVRFDPSTLPGLTVPWRDGDSGAPLVTTVHLSADQVRPRTSLVLAGITPGGG